MKTNTKIILRGKGPAPTGYATCRDPKCDANRDPCSGRFQRIPNHYHPIIPSKPAASTWY